MPLKSFFCLILLFTPAFLLGCDEYRQVSTGAALSSNILLKDLPQNARLLIGRDVFGLRAPSYVSSTGQVHYDPIYVAGGRFYQENGAGLTDVESKDNVTLDAFYAKNTVYVLWSPAADRLWTIDSKIFQVPREMEFPLHVDYAPAYEADTSIDYIRFAHSKAFLHNLAPFDQLTVRVDTKNLAADTSAPKWQQLTVGDLLKIMGPRAQIVTK